MDIYAVLAVLYAVSAYPEKHLDTGFSTKELTERKDFYETNTRFMSLTYYCFRVDLYILREQHKRSDSLRN
jgi:hypothetical protein